MKQFLRGIPISAFLMFFSVVALYSAEAKPGTLICVGLYSETSDGYASSRVAGKGDWVPVKVGDVIPANGEIRINVDRDWVESSPAGNPNAVYEIDGPDTGTIVKSVASIPEGQAQDGPLPKGSVSSPDRGTRTSWS